MKTRMVISLVPGLCALCAFALFTVSCTRDDREDNTGNEQRQPMIFGVSTDTNWNAPQPGGNNTSPEDRTRAADAIPEQVITLQGKNPSDKLYMRLTVSDWNDELSGLRQECSTRAQPIKYWKNEFTQPFGLLARISENNWATDPTTNYLDNVEIKRQADSITWRPDETIYWPGKGWKIRMMAYAPHNATGLSFDKENVYKLNYDVPTDADEQADLMIARTEDDLDGEYNQPYKFVFKHILAAVRFVAGDGISPDELKSVSLNYISYKVYYHVRDEIWAYQKGDGDKLKTNFSQEFHEEKYQTPSGEIKEWAATFMMAPFPQTEDVSNIQVTLTSGETLKHTDGFGWKENTIYTYHITRKK